MKTIIKIFFLLGFQMMCYAQDNLDNTLVKLYKLNMALPDMPAFKALGTEPSNLLRPSLTQDFSFVSSEFFDGKNLIFPTSFAVEVSPILLMDVNKMTLKEFQKNNAIKTSRISLGTFRDSLKTVNVALGYRLTAINKGDLRTDEEALKKLANLLKDQAVLEQDLEYEYIKLKNIKAEDIESQRDEIDKYIAEHIEEQKSNDFDSKIAGFKKKYKEDNWNAKKLDFAAAIVGQSPDSLVSNVSFRNASFWSSYAVPLFKNKGQFVIGINYQFNKIKSVDYHAVSLSNRNYFGSNRIKVFIEEQGDYDEYKGKKINFLLNLGAELNLMSGFWIDLNCGFEKNNNNNTSEFISQFKFRYTLPEKN